MPVGASSLLTSISLELLPGREVVAGTMGLLVGGAVVGLEQCWGMLGETGSILTMAGAEPRQTDGDRTTEGDGRHRRHRVFTALILWRLRLKGTSAAKVFRASYL